ncbi:heat shock protein, partial [Biomphalaria glabrata]
NSYGHLQAYCCSYTFQRTTTYVQSSFQRNLWPASSDVHTNFSSMFDIHGAQRSHIMSTSPRRAHFSQEMSVPFIQPHLTQEMSVSHRHGKFSQQMSISHVQSPPRMPGPLFHMSWPSLQGNVAQQMSMHHVQTNIAPQMLVPHVQPHYSQQKTTPSVKRRKSSKQKTVLPSNNKDESKHPRRKSSKEITVEPSKHKDVSPKTNEPSKHKDVSPQTVEPSKHKETVIPTEVEYDKVSKENQCLDIVSKNILQESSIKAHEAQQEQKEANISQMISEPLEDSDLNEESLLLDPSLLGFGSEDSSLDIPPELETCDQIEDPHNSLCIPQTAECQLVKGPMNEDLTVSQSDSQQTDVPEFDQISTLFDPNVPNSNGNKNDNDSAYFSTSPSINSNEDIDWQELYDNILSLN